MSYAKAYQKLAEYEPKELAFGRYFDSRDGSCCALGAIAPSLRTLYGYTDWLARAGVFGSENEPRREHALSELTELGLSLAEAEEIQRMNDGFLGNRAERYRFVLANLRARAGLPSSG